MKPVTVLFVLIIYILGSCTSGRYVVQTATGVDSVIIMGQLPLNIKVEKSIVVNGELSLVVIITIDEPEPIVNVVAYKFVDGKEVFIGNTDNYGRLNIKTTFSSPDTFSFTSPSYQKKYLFVGRKL